MKLRDVSITVKITLLVIGVTYLALALTFAMTTLLDAREYRRELVKETTTAARMAAEYSVGSLAFGYKEETEATIAKLSLLSGLNYVAVYDKAGDLFAAHSNPAAAGRPPGKIPPPGGSSAAFTRDELDVCEPMHYRGTRFGTLCMNVSTASLPGRIAARAKLLAALLVGISLLAYFIASGLQSLVSKPLLMLADSASRLAERQDYSLRTGIRQGDEIGNLAGSFDKMIESLEKRSGERDAAMAALSRARDTLEEKVAERTVELRSANRELEAFTYSASHDLRAPLRRLDGFSALLEEGYARGFDETGRKYLSRMRAGCRQMDEVINSLLKLSHINRRELTIKPVDLTAVVKAVAGRLREIEPGRRADIVVAEGLAAAGDPGLLEEAVENLLSNAWKFTEGTERARIEFGETGARKGGKAYFVKDNGAGFDMAYAGKLFQPFQRLHSSSVFPGTGIGLSIVQRIIERHGGRIWAEGKEGEGAVFYFILGAAAAGDKEDER
ncbi:MAG: hypothetical protein AUJ51_07325 [Elusimicrobia bacterium CG1_02_56_21]|nr:MAG: hypothetical protein AUJ51_07325 [Elusimicrobia bacterium CG1_02_56_21]